MIECLFTNYVVVGSGQVAVAKPSDFTTNLGKDFVNIQVTIECGFTLKRVRDMTRIYSQSHCTDK